MKTRIQCGDGPRGGVVVELLQKHTIPNFLLLRYFCLATSVSTSQVKFSTYQHYSITVFDLAQEMTRLRKKSRNEYAGPCPSPTYYCKNDGFSVNLDKNGGKGGFMCRGCWDPSQPPFHPDRPGWGDPIDFFRHFKGMSFQEAKAAYEGDQMETPLPKTASRMPAPDRLAHLSDDYRSERWQESVRKMLEEARTRLWSPEGSAALDYLRRRGLNDKTIRNANLGYALEDGIPRVLIPNGSYNEQRYMAVARRNLRANCPSSERWRDVAGGTKDALYLSACLTRLMPTVLTEGAFDALILVQQCYQLVNVVSTNSVQACRTDEIRDRLARQPLVLVAFDTDKAGEDGARYWLHTLPNAYRLRPTKHDINEMFLDNWNLPYWIETGLIDAQRELAKRPNTQYQNSSPEQMSAIGPCGSVPNPCLPSRIPHCHQRSQIASCHPQISPI